MKMETFFTNTLRKNGMRGQIKPKLILRLIGEITLEAKPAENLPAPSLTTQSETLFQLESFLASTDRIVIKDLP